MYLKKKHDNHIKVISRSIKMNMLYLSNFIFKSLTKFQNNLLFIVIRVILIVITTND